MWLNIGTTIPTPHSLYDWTYQYKQIEKDEAVLLILQVVPGITFDTAWLVFFEKKLNWVILTEGSRLTIG